MEKKYKLLIIGVILIILVIVGTYYLTSKYRTNKKINKINKEYKSTITYQTDYCNKNLREYKLVDFHVSSSTNTFMVGLSVGDYIDIKILENILFYGTRYIELEIFNKDGKNNSTPVISYGIKKGNWITSYNTISALEVFKYIADYAFSERFISNYMDPLFIFLDIKTNNKQTLDNLYDIIISTCNHYLLDKKYLKEKINMARVSICDIMSKIVLFSNSGYESSNLANIISMSTKGPYLQRIQISDIISNNVNSSLNAPEISIDNDNISFKNDYLDDYIEIKDHTVNFLNYGVTTDFKLKIDGSKFPENNTGLELIHITQVTGNKIVVKKRFKSELAGEMIRLRFYYNKDINENTLSNRNKKTLTIVIPDPNIMSTNYSPRDAWYAGCQFAALNFQTPDKYMLENFQFFKNACIKLKIETLRNKRDIIDKVELQEGLKEKYPFPKTIQKYNINYNFLNKFMGTEVYLTTLLGPNIRLASTIPFKNNSEVEMTLNFNSNNTLFKIVPGLTKANDSISFKVLDPLIPFNTPYYLCVDPKLKRLIVKNISDEIKITKFGVKEARDYTKQISDYDNLLRLATFLPLNPVSSNPTIMNLVDEYVSLGIPLDLEDIDNKPKNALDNIKKKKTIKLYYIKYNSGFNIDNILYTKNQKLMNKIMTISNTMNKEITIWRPIREDGFYPLGDYVSTNNSIVHQLMHDFTGDPFATYIFTVNGGVRKPIDYELIWSGVQHEVPSIDRIDENWISIWKPIPPEGYTSLGFVFENGKAKPSLNIIRCIKTSLLDLAPPEMFMTFGGELTNNTRLSYESEKTAMKSKFHMYNLIWNNRYISDDPLIELNPPSRTSIRPLGIWNLNLVTRGDFNYNSNIILFDYYIPYELFIDNGNKMAPPIEFNYPVFIKKNNIYSKDKLYIDNEIYDDKNMDEACFRINNIYSSDIKPLNKLTERKIAETNLYNGNIVHINNSSDTSDTTSNMCLNLPNSYWSNAYTERHNQGITPYLNEQNLKFSSCEINDNFGSQWVVGANNTIKLLGNPHYCLTASTKLNEKKQEIVIDDLDDPKNKLYLDKCEPGSVGQQFRYVKTDCEDGTGVCDQIQAVNPNGKKTDVLYWSIENNDAQIVNSKYEAYRTQFHFNSLPEQYHFNIPTSQKLYINTNMTINMMNENLKNRIYGSPVLVLYKIKRVKKPNLSIQIIPQTINNPLDEQVDLLYFHVFLRGCILYQNPKEISKCVFIVGLNNKLPETIENNMQLTIEPEFLDFDFYEPDNRRIKVGDKIDLLQINSTSNALTLKMHVEAKNNLKPGTWVLCPNGDFNSIDSNNPNYIPESSSCYLAKIIRPIIVDGNSKEIYEYEVIFSINGCEANDRNKDFNRPNYCNTRVVHIRDMYLYRDAPIYL